LERNARVREVVDLSTREFTMLRPADEYPANELPRNDYSANENPANKLRAVIQNMLKHVGEIPNTIYRVLYTRRRIPFDGGESPTPIYRVSNIGRRILFDGIYSTGLHSMSLQSPALRSSFAGLSIRCLSFREGEVEFIPNDQYI
jgi:hypothetical protein